MKPIVEVRNLTGEFREQIVEGKMGYYSNHTKCPKCRSIDVNIPNRGVISISGSSEYIDRNRTSCNDCSWTGIVHDLI